MIGKDIAKSLVKQIGVELENAHKYLLLSTWFDIRGLNEWAQVMRDSSTEERAHAQKFIDFLIKCNVKFDMPGIPSVTMPEFKDGGEILAYALETESQTTVKIKALMSEACEYKEYPVQAILWAFIDEQVQSEDQVRNWMDMFKAGTPPYLAEVIG